MHLALFISMSLFLTPPTALSQGASQKCHLFVHPLILRSLSSGAYYFYNTFRKYSFTHLMWGREGFIVTFCCWRFGYLGQYPAFLLCPQTGWGPQVRNHSLRTRNVKIKFALIVFQGQMILTWLTEILPLSLSSYLEFFSYTCLLLEGGGKEALFLHSRAYLACLREFLRVVVVQLKWCGGGKRS